MAEILCEYEVFLVPNVGTQVCRARKPGIRVSDWYKTGTWEPAYTRGLVAQIVCEYEVLLAIAIFPQHPPPLIGFPGTCGPKLCEHEVLLVPVAGTRAQGTRLNRVSFIPGIRVPGLV